MRPCRAGASRFAYAAIFVAVIAAISFGAAGLLSGHSLPPAPSRVGAASLPSATASGVRSPALSAPAVNGSAPSRVAPRDVFPPAPRETAGDLPGYTSDPAPMGLADLGRDAAGSYVYNTSGFAATLDFHAPFTAYNPGYAAFAEAPDWATIQLNTVLTNTSYPRVPAGTYGTFWVQNVVHFDGSSLQFEDNLWNFSGTAGLHPGTLLNPAGTLVSNEYYYRLGPIVPVTYPFVLVLYNNVSLVAGHASVYLNYSVTDGAGTHAGTYDNLTFRATQTAKPAFQVDGIAPDPADHWNDAELIVGGDGSGSNAIITSINATATLQYWNSVLRGYVAVPAAYDYGVDSGETSEGIAATYTGSTETLLAGPSMLYGLWNTAAGTFGPAAAPGWIQVGLTVTPSWGFVFATENSSYGGAPLSEARLAYVPTNLSGTATIELPPPSPTDPYVLVAWAAGYANDSASPMRVAHNTTGISLALAAALSSPLQAPVYLNGDPQAAAVGEAGIPAISYGTGNQTLFVAATGVDLAPPFLTLNDYHFPSFILFAASELNVTVHVNGFFQAATASTYTIDLGTTVSYPGYSQGYYFFYGRGSFDVTNTTLPGNSTAFYQNEAYPPAAVEFFDTHSSEASEITSDQESFGVAFVNATDGVVSNLTSEAGANALDAINSVGVQGTDVASVGTDVESAPSWAAYLVNASAVLNGLTSLNGALALAAENASWTIDSLVADNATAIEAVNGSASTVHGLSVLDNEPSSFGGYWINSTGFTLTGLSVVGLGLALVYDHQASLVGVNASGPGSEAVYSFFGSSAGSFRYVNASDGALALNLSEAIGVSLQSVDATDGSVGVYLLGTNNTTVQGVRASGLSAGFVWQYGANGTISDAVASGGAVPVVVTNATNLTIRGIAVASTAVGDPYYINPAMGFILPEAALDLGNDSTTSVTNVSANAYAFGVQANYTNGTTLSDITAWAGDVAVSLNATNNTSLGRLFSFGEVVGVDANNSSNVSVTASTIEASVEYGFESLNGSAVTLENDNFVANNGASATGSYSTAHVQASITGTTAVTLHANYWSDAAGRATYVVNRTHIDSAPRAAFLGNWLLFSETGLAHGTPWGIGVVGFGLYASSPLFYLPSWTVTNGSDAFTVFPPSDYSVVPVSGTVPYSGANVTVPIVFTSLASGSGSLFLPLWAIGAIAGAAVAAVLVTVVTLRSRAARRQAP